MSYWDRLRAYGTGRQEADAGFVLRPKMEFDRFLEQTVDDLLLPLGWSRRKRLRWVRPIQTWADLALEFQSLKSGVGARWGFRLSFVPTLDEWRKVSGDMHLSYDPLDYQRDVAPWALSRFSTDDELRIDVPDLMKRAIAGANSLTPCCCDLEALADCYEEKKTRKAVRLGFYQYPHEVLAFAAVLGLIGREADARQEADRALDRLEAPASVRQKWWSALSSLWAKGV